MRFLLGLAGGFVWSNWIEYAYHRWAMHWPSLYEPAAMRHALHHSVPSNREHITMTFGFWAATFLSNVLVFSAVDRLLQLRMLTGVTVAFLIYIVGGIEIHLRTHDGRWVPKLCRSHHLLHHIRPQKNFNIFLPLFDSILGTRQAP